MDTDAFVAKFPRLHHLAHADAWPSLREHGLLSVAALLERSALGTEEQQHLLTRRRDRSRRLPVPGFASVVVRDQGPLSEAKLAACLTDGTTPAQWITLLNSMVFLFPRQDGLVTLMKKYGHEPVVVLELDTASVVSAHGDRIRLAPINTGATVYVPARRGPDTFRSIEDHDRARPVKEVALLDGLPDLERHLVSAVVRSPGGGLTSLL